jgi:UDP-N-acetylglucosamine--N-acetylmuramyl-(pentapeptide) pyrophosphoryl-undecaprenol N-acetylglucosamine transferase
LNRAFVLAAGGTGGHLFPAEALARQLARDGAVVHLATDRRADAFASDVPGISMMLVRAGRLGGGPVQAAYGVAEMALGLLQARRLLRRLRPQAVVGFGGYPSIPTMLAATQLGLRTVIHEQNAVLGRANRLLAARVDRIATGFAQIAGLRDPDRERLVYTGNPVRPAILAVGAIGYRPPEPGQKIELLVLGGSQGARIFAEIVPPALAALGEPLRGRLRISLQARPEDRAAAAAELRQAGIEAAVESFFGDMPDRLARVQLVICRAGASTIAELAAAGRPALLVPYPYAADDHQAANARAFAEGGGGWAMPQTSLTVEVLADRLTELLGNPATLANAAVAARRFGRDDAADRLAEIVLSLTPGCSGATKERAA